ncbi:MAG: NlpC/P60 family protein [candidate division Zixibacteria bacterium]|nr:NlpC/P60 family protein [candidate division Zixibacteria bacterium]
MKSIALFILILFANGCAPNRHFAPPEEKPREEDVSKIDYKNKYENKNWTKKTQNITTNSLLGLGEIIQSYLGRPSAGLFRDNKEGLDCSQFTKDVFERFNHTELPRTAEKQFTCGERVDINRLRYGDLVFFRIEGRAVAHVGIYIGYNEFIHSSSSGGIIISPMEDKYWRKRLIGARRILLWRPQ